MYTQRIKQMQDAMQSRREVPGVNMARKQGQAMSSVPGAGVDALRETIGRLSPPPGKSKPINAGSPTNPPRDNRQRGAGYIGPPPVQTGPAMGGIVPMAQNNTVHAGGSPTFDEAAGSQAIDFRNQQAAHQQAQQQPSPGIAALRSRLTGGGRRVGIRPSHR